jgi:hypothetical protein
MPIHRVTRNGKTGYQYGTHGTVYPTRAQAVKQAQAIHASGYKEPAMSKAHGKKK